MSQESNPEPRRHGLKRSRGPLEGFARGHCLADGTEVSVYQQNSSRSQSFSQGERVGVVWDPEASFSL